MKAYPLTKEEIKEMIAVSTLKNKAIIAFFSVTGAGTRSLTNTQYRDISYQLSQKAPIVYLENRGNKYYSFISKKAMDHIKRYLRWREMKYGKIADKDPVFASDYNLLSDDKKQESKLSERTIQVIIKEAAKYAAISSFKKVVATSLREYYKTIISRSNEEGESFSREEQLFLSGYASKNHDLFFEKNKIKELQKRYAEYSFIH